MAVDLTALKVTERIATGIGLGESHFREFKSATDQSQMPPRKRDVKAVAKDIAETLVAFANADGGELYVGIEDDGTVTGTDYAETQMVFLLNAYKTHVHSGTPLPAPTVSRVRFESHTVLYFHVPKSTERVHLTADGRCLQRFDRQNRPVPAEEIQYSRREQNSREYDRTFIDAASLPDLDLELIDAISKERFGGQSPEKFLQYMDVAEYGANGLQLRRAALLLFARDIGRWHPRCEVRIIRVSGTELGVGKNYNVLPRDDQTVRGNVLHILQAAWDTLRPYLTQTKLVESGIFRETLVFPEEACREALINSVAHRDYSAEGKGIETLIFDDRLEVKSPGGLLSSIVLEDLQNGRRTHQSRNAYLARVLREFGYMREMGEGMLRIFATMRDRDLVPPELHADASKFDIVFHHRSVFSPKDQEWLKAYGSYNLSRNEQRTILLGRDGHALSTNEIIRALQIVDTDEFRQLVESLRRKGILYSALERGKVKAAGPNRRREVARFGIRPPDQTDQYRQELMRVLRELGTVSTFSGPDVERIRRKLSSNSPYREAPIESLKLLSFVDERSRPLPLLTAIWQTERAQTVPARGRPGLVPNRSENDRLSAIIVTLKKSDGYGFMRPIGDTDDVYFHRSNLVDTSEWPQVRQGSTVTFEYGLAEPANGRRRAHKVKIDPSR